MAKKKRSVQTKLVPESGPEKGKGSYNCESASGNKEELNQLFNRLWEAADELRANSKLRSSQYSTPVLGILFLRYADHKFDEATRKLKKKYTKRKRINS